MKAAAFAALIAVLVSGPARAVEEPEEADSAQATICDLIETSATANDLPADFFIRLIWKESSFRPDAVSPVGAQGIAQFMPYTATERGLADPFDPAQAIPKSAEFLRDLRARFGNLGLAAAAYNAGPQRVQDWLDERGGLPWETQNFVYGITGRAAEDWAAGVAAAAPAEAAEEKPQTCVELVALLGRPGAGDAMVATGPKPPPPPPWGVQLAGNFSRDVALRSYARLQAEYAGLLGGREPIVVSERLRGRGPRPIHQVRIGADTRDGANELCGRLKAAGASCIVLKN